MPDIVQDLLVIFDQMGVMVSSGANFKESCRLELVRYVRWYSTSSNSRNRDGTMWYNIVLGGTMVRSCKTGYQTSYLEC